MRRDTMLKDKDKNNDHNVIDEANLPNPVSNDNDLHIKDEVYDDDNKGHVDDEEDKEKNK